METKNLTKTQKRYLELMQQILSFPATSKTQIAEWLRLSKSALTDRELRSDDILKIDIAILEAYLEAIEAYYADLKDREIVSITLSKMRKYQTK